MTPLNDAEIGTLCLTLPLWRIEDGQAAIVRDLVFADFKMAFGFMSEIAAVADQSDHHPEWSNVFNRVHIRLTTHDAGGLSARDVAMAHMIDTVAPKFGGQ
jgi:4a-hydroxytetrahydrobiopterin dehydratase